MKQFSLTILMLLGLLTAVCGLGSCTDDLGMKSDLTPVPDGERIVLGFAPYGMEKSATRATIPDTEFESAVEKLDVFVFDADGNRQHYERVTFSKTYPNHGTLALNKWRSEFTQGAKYTIHLVANAADSFSSESINTFIDLQNATEKYDYIHLTAVGDYQRHFVMYGKSEEVVLNPGENQNVSVEIPLVREAAKIILTLTEGRMNGSSEYFTFSTGSATRFRFSNLQTKARYVYDADDLPDNALINTVLTTSCVEGPSTGDAPHSITVTTYAYPNSWKNERAKMTHLVVQLPYMEDENTIVKNNFYSIPITNQTALEANHVYTINATIEAAGSTTDYKPKEIKGTYSVTDWISEEIEIGGESDPHYLTFDKEYLVMRGIESDSIGFASSHNLEITLNEAYFYNKYGVITSIKNEGNNTFNIKVNSSATNKEDVSKSISEVVTWKDFHGNYIHIDCPMPKNNLPHYITFTVKHKSCGVQGCNLSTKITIEQYPTEYITSYFGWHSYRDDFIQITETPDANLIPPTTGEPCTYENIQNENFQGNGVVRLYYGPEVTVTGSGDTQVINIDSTSTGFRWSYRSTNIYSTASNDKKNSGSGFFKSKMAFQPEDNDTIFTAPKSSISQFFWQGNQLWEPVSDTNNPRIYQINLTSTKKPTYQYGTWKGTNVEYQDMDYDVTQPRLDANGYTDPSEDNLRLVSPAFAVASRLGAVSTTAKSLVIEDNSGDKTGFRLSSITYLGKEPTYYQIAAEHCARYVEVYRQRDKDGNLIEGAPDIVLDNWRLPTPAELRILIYYQGMSNNPTPPDALDYQLPGNYFWTADPNGPVYNWNHEKEYNENDVGLRCVHDMTNIQINGN